MDIERSKQLFTELRTYLKKYGNSSIGSSYSILNNTILLLQSSNNEEEKKKIIVQNYKMLYYGKGSLSDFCIWDNDFQKRKELNEPLENIHNELWEIVRDYV